MKPLRLVLVSSLVVVSTAQAGVTLVWERVLGPDKKGVETAKLEGDRVRVDSDAGAANVIWDASTKTLTTVDPKTKSFSKVDEASAKAGAERLKAMKAQTQALMKERLSSLPPDQRAKVEAMMGAKETAAAPEKPEPTKVTATGRKETVNGFACEVYTVERGSVVHESCLVPWASSPVKKDDLKPLASLAEFFRTLMPGPAAADPTRDMGSYPGFPVRTVKVGGEGPQLVTTLKSATRGTISADDFKPPADFTEKANPFAPGAEHGQPGPLGAPHGKPAKP